MKHVQNGFAIVHPAQPKYMGGLSLPGGVRHDEWDGFHSVVLADELSRLAPSL